ncbi:unnamed protein product, partial [Linum tenue]
KEQILNNVRNLDEEKKEEITKILEKKKSQLILQINVSLMDMKILLMVTMRLLIMRDEMQTIQTENIH